MKAGDGYRKMNICNICKKEVNWEFNICWKCYLKEMRIRENREIKEMLIRWEKKYNEKREEEKEKKDLKDIDIKIRNETKRRIQNYNGQFLDCEICKSPKMKTNKRIIERLNKNKIYDGYIFSNLPIHHKKIDELKRECFLCNRTLILETKGDTYAKYISQDFAMYHGHKWVCCVCNNKDWNELLKNICNKIGINNYKINNKLIKKDINILLPKREVLNKLYIK